MIQSLLQLTGLAQKADERFGTEAIRAKAEPS